MASSKVARPTRTRDRCYILLAYAMYKLVPYDLHAVVKRDDPAPDAEFGRKPETAQ